VLGLLRGVFRWRVRIRMPPVVPRPHQPLIVVFNHTSAIDAFLIADVVWRHLRHVCQPLVKAELFEVPGLRLIARHAGAIPVTRGAGEGREAAYQNAVDRARRGATVMIAPEGTITHDGSLLPLRHGAARLALESGADERVALGHTRLAIVDTVGGMRTKPIEVYAQGATIEILKNHLFNWAIWPDFTEIPTREAPFLRYREIEPWAWARLTQRLRSIRRRRAKLRPAAA
jgi:1-acyl-sn-glycerol-3-phosphate acyltransferase